MTESSKVVDVLLPLGITQRCYVHGHMCLFTLRALLNAIIRCLQLNTNGELGRQPGGGLLVIDAVG